MPTDYSMYDDPSKYDPLNLDLLERQRRNKYRASLLTDAWVQALQWFCNEPVNLLNTLRDFVRDVALSKLQEGNSILYVFVLKQAYLLYLFDS